MSRNMKEIERIANEAMESGTSYGKLVAKMPRKEKKPKTTKGMHTEKVEIPISEPLKRRKGKIKNGITTEHLNQWNEVRRMFGVEQAEVQVVGLCEEHDSILSETGGATDRTEDAEHHAETDRDA